jgi:hypothetical protein
LDAFAKLSSPMHSIIQSMNHQSITQELPCLEDGTVHERDGWVCLCVDLNTNSTITTTNSTTTTTTTTNYTTTK